MVWTRRAPSFTFQYFYLVFVGLLVRTEYTGSPAAGHLDAVFFVSFVFKETMRWFPSSRLLMPLHLQPLPFKSINVDLLAWKAIGVLFHVLCPRSKEKFIF
jgi:hypothetical protein